jgi:eukaryotic-like serine/threonine-protein kinase
MLITEWPTLKRWLEDGHALRGFLHELRQAARQWASRNKPADLVWRGATAQDALSTAQRHVLDLSAVETEFLAAVRAQAARSRRRRVYVFATVFSALGLVFAGGTIAFIRVQNAEHEAKDKAVAAQRAQADLQGKLDVIAEKERARLQAEKDMLAAQGAEKLSQDELEKANVQLKKTLEEAKAEKVKAEEAQAKAELEQQKATAEKAKAVANAEQARKSSEEAKAANARTDALLAKEREHVRALEAEKKKIYDKVLQ